MTPQFVAGLFIYLTIGGALAAYSYRRHQEELEQHGPFIVALAIVLSAAIWPVALMMAAAHVASALPKLWVLIKLRWRLYLIDRELKASMARVAELEAYLATRRER